MTTLDCLRRGELTCVNGFCVTPFMPVLARGSECDPANPSGYCETGSVCLNCNPEGRGYRCVDNNQPCCNSGDYDEFFCGTTDFPAIGVRWTNSCCNYKCYRPDHVNACGGCGTDCVDPQNVCWVPGTERCIWTGSTFSCSATEDETWCPDDADSSIANQCVPDGPGTFHCWQVSALFDWLATNPLSWEELLLSTCIQDSSVLIGLECTTDWQCDDCDHRCHCLPYSSGYSFFNTRSRCECSP